MKIIGKWIRNIILFVFLIGLLTAGIDYFRFQKGKIPIFQNSAFDSKTMIQTYHGLFYEAERTIVASINEPLTESNHLVFKWFYFLEKEISFGEEKQEEKLIEIEKENICSKSLKMYVETEEYTVFTDCIKTIHITNQEKKEEFKDFLKSHSIEEMENEFTYLGLASDGETMKFFMTEEYSLYICPKETKRNIMIGGKDFIFQKEMC